MKRQAVRVLDDGPRRSHAKLLALLRWIDEGSWKQVWAEMTDSELEDHLFTYLWLSIHTPNAHAGRVAQLVAEAERRGQAGMVERARVKAKMTPIANAE